MHRSTTVNFQDLESTGMGIIDEYRAGGNKCRLCLITKSSKGCKTCGCCEYSADVRIGYQ